MDDAMLTVSQACHVLGLSRQQVIRLSDRGTLVTERTPYGRLFRQSDVSRLAADRRKHPPVPGRNTTRRKGARARDQGHTPGQATTRAAPAAGDTEYPAVGGAAV